MNIQDLIDEVAGDGGVSRDFVDALIKRITATIIKTVVTGEAVHIRGFGRFTSYKIAQRWRRNPRTGLKMYCPATTSVKFRPSEVFRVAVAAKLTPRGP